MPSDTPSAAQLAIVTYLTGINQAGTLASPSYWTWNQDNPATYSSANPAFKWSNDSAGNTLSLTSAAGTAGGTVTYAFDPTSNFTDVQKAAFVASLTLWSDEANISFALTTDTAHADVLLTVDNSNLATQEIGAPAVDTTVGGTAVGDELSPSGTNVIAGRQARIIFNTTGGYGTLGSFTAQGGYSYSALTHEVGHLLGLGHTGPYNDGNGAAGADQAPSVQTSAFDSRQWSVMSYIEPSDTTAAQYANYTVTGTEWSETTGNTTYQVAPETPMMLDILAAQRLYGTPTSTALSGGQVFGFNTNITDASAAFFNFSVNVHPVVTLWDAGTGNTLDLSGYSSASTVDLLPGTFSSAGGLTNNIGIAFGTAIDTAIGGAGNDSFTVNTDNDTINGGGGTNTAVFASDYAGYTFSTVSGALRVTDTATQAYDDLTNIQELQFTHDTVLEDPHSFTGTISDFQPGDTIDLVGITAIGASLGANNVLTLTESDGSTVTLDLDPSQDFSDESFLIAPDGSGGTNVVAESDSEAIAFTGTGEVLLVVDPGKVSGTISSFQSGDTIDLAGIGTATGASLDRDNILTVQESSSRVALQLDPGQSFTGFSVDPISDDHKGSDIVLSKLLSGIGYNPAAGENYDETIDSFTGKLNPVVSFKFDTGFFTAATFTVSQTDAFAVSSSGLLYDFNLSTGAIATKPSDPNLDSLTYNGTALVGIGYNPSANENYIETIDPLTGNTSTLVSFKFDTGFFSATTFAASQTDAYAVSSSGLLYDFNLSTGAIATKPSDPNIDSLTYNGTTLVGIGFSPSSNENYIETIDPLTGNTKTLVSFKFDTGFFSATTFAASQTDAYAVSSSGLLYDFNLSTGGITTTKSDSSLDAVATSPTEPNTPCFLTGTQIWSTSGGVPVERLAIGDPILTHTNTSHPIKWIGHRTISCRRHPRPQDVWPIRIRPGAFGPNLPTSDLFLSPEHAVFTENVLVPIRCLVNGVTIAQEPRDEVTYFHIELQQHDVILAEGLPCETWLDTGNRTMFANCPVTELHPDFARPAAHAWAHDACAPLVESGPQLEAIRARLHARAGIAIEPPEAHQSGELRGWIDLATPETIIGWAWQPDHPHHFTRLEILANDTLLGEVVAADQRDDVRDAGRLDIISNGATIGQGEGRCGFTFRPTPSLSPFIPHTIRVRRVADGAELWNSGQITLAATQRLDAPSLTGFATALRATAAFATPTERSTLLRFLEQEVDRLRTAPPPDSTAPLALFIDETLPAPDRDSASQVALDHMRALQTLGYRVAFAACHPIADDTASLEALGITLCPASVEEMLRRHGAEAALVYLHRVGPATLYAALVRHHCPKALLVYSVADLHFLRTARQARLEGNAALAAESRRLRERELRAASLADRVITHSPAEAAILRQHAPHARVHVVPWSIAPRPTVVPFARRRGLAFIGGYRHAPNVDAARWLVEHIMPLVWQQAPEIECLLVGSDMPDRLRRLTGAGIVPLGHVPDLATVFDRVRLTVAPLRYGAGIKGKLLHSLAAGLPCVVTPIAAEGVDLPPLLRGCVGETAAELARQILRLHAEEADNTACARAGLKLIGDEFSPERIDQSMAATIGRRQGPDFSRVRSSA